MKTLYIDCTNGVSSDMLLKALEALAAELQTHGDKGEGHHHGRSYGEVKKIINNANNVALRIYEVIAKAEGTVHGSPHEFDEINAVDSVHFHEVGRDEAIKNAIGIGMALSRIGPVEIIVSHIIDGNGFIDCAHGRIPVPVPAVRAIMDECGKSYPAFLFQKCEDVDTEMVTPSGLASLIGMGAKPANSSGSQTSAGGMMFMEGTVIASAEAKGTRDTGRPGLRAYLIEKQT